MYISIDSFAAVTETGRSLNALLDAKRRLENLRAEIVAAAEEHPDLADITSSIADSLTDAWDDSGASAYINDADDALHRWAE